MKHAVLLALLISGIGFSCAQAQKPSAKAEKKISFVNDVVPVLTRAGCNQGSGNLTTAVSPTTRCLPAGLAIRSSDGRLFAVDFGNNRVLS